MTVQSGTTAASSLLYTVGAVLVLDHEGKRLLAKYYEHDDMSHVRRRQDAFEAALYQRTRKALNNEVTTCEGRIVLYRANLDVLIYVVGMPEQNELMLATVLDTYCDVLTEVMKPQLDKRAFLEHYDLAALALDETVDRGVILETDVGEIIGRICKTPANIVDMPLNEQTLTSAFSFAKQQLKSFLK